MPDPDFGSSEYEPSDEDLRELSQEAFADVEAQNKRALQKLREEIAQLRASVLQKKAPPR